MYLISDLAQMVGLSRTTLLYYEKLGLISSQRQENGYRYYTDQNIQQLVLIQLLQAAGLTLKECLACLESRLDRNLLSERLVALEDEISKKEKSRELLLSMLGVHSMRTWHQTLDEQAPEVHLEWLIKQGFNEKQALRLRWLSRDINEHEQYMLDFEYIFNGLERLGPGDIDDTLQALHCINIGAGKLLDIGCGKGINTLFLYENSNFSITALDNDEYNLSCVKEKISSHSLEDRVSTILASMTELPFEESTFDVIWAEGCAYIMGVSQALDYWKKYLKKGGFIVVSDLVWLTKLPDDEVLKYWKVYYPDMTSDIGRHEMCERDGFHVIKSFNLCNKSWSNYLTPLKQRIDNLSDDRFKSSAYNDLKSELNIHSKYLGQYNYKTYVLQYR